MTARKLSILAALVTTGLVSQAYALDAYRDRRGLFFGVSLAGSMGQASGEGLKSDRELGINIGARVGGGINRKLTLDFSLDHHSHSEKNAGITLDSVVDSGMIGANFFLMDGLYLRGMVGMASVGVTADGKGSDYDDTGLGFGAGAGYEFFANADLAVGLGGDFRQFFFQVDQGKTSVDVDYSMVNFGLTATWY